MLTLHEVRLLSCYICTGMVSGGTTLCLMSMERMEHTLSNVARFTDGKEVRFSPLMRRNLSDSAVTGQVVSLVGLTLLSLSALSAEAVTAEALLDNMQPLIILPALILVIASLLMVLRYPVRCSPIASHS